jgi:hypothetical protein
MSVWKSGTGIAALLLYEALDAAREHRDARRSRRRPEYDLDPVDVARARDDVGRLDW